ncbi:conserved hypothetical protein [Rippkaea orientalis PCC 8801]|uniref:Uncharacterized protein n=1 Tax=Rippkaea orientalis (strain PCC 8801 / RF-1) TaxID=41431 RepID=B7K4J2_RIPO1|nr:hypothetical protein [Rippkaea orientalis]ACK65457.1 conserved hypothetical protein [Rippkaea orientalis PCC 8801]
MLTDFIPFQFAIDKAMIAGVCLWALALYLGLSSVREWIIEGLNRWFNFAERSLYFSAKEFERTRPMRESQNAFYASIFSIIPFLAIGGLCNWGIELGLGQSWSVSGGMLMCIACGIYELGRRST